jgi:hypothetical protein
MSSDVLHRVFDGQGFDGTPLEIDLAALHVPYGASGLSAVEPAILEAAERRERIGLAGPIGCGKTSILRYALDQPELRVAPIWVSVARDSDDVVLDPKLFVAHVVQHTLRAAEKSSALDRDLAREVLQAATQRRPLPTTARRAAGKVAAKFWIANAELAGDVTTTLYGQDLTRPLVEVVEAAGRAIEAIGAFGYDPVIVIDDSDAFTRGGTDVEQARLVEAFFGRTLKALTELPCGLVVALHSDYEALPEYQAARREWGVLQRVLEVPETVSGHLRRILARRIELTADARIDDVLAPDAVEALAELNRGPARRNLRTVLAVAHEALAGAVDRDREIIDAGDVRRAATKHLP